MDATLGILAALATAAAKSATDIFTKVATETLDELRLLTLTWGISAILLLCATFLRYPALLLDPTSELSSLTKPNFGWALLAGGSLNAIASVFYIRAFKYSDASLVAPIMLLTPVFLLITSPIMLGERVSLHGAIGILLAVAGSYMLGRTANRSSLLSPFKALATDRGIQSMLVTVAIWSVTSNLDKIGVLASTPLLWAASISTFVACQSLILCALFPNKNESKPSIWQGIGAGTGQAAQAFFQNIALSFLMVPYVIAIKRTSAVITVLASGALLKEKTGARLAGAIIMMAGTVLMIFASYF